VGTRKPNAWGLFDMHGNVWEWCADRYDDEWYAKSPKDDTTGPTAGSARVLRGGSWYVNSTDCRSSFRGRTDPALMDDGYGFRVVVVPAGH
jgi:formylglycine-generating enzyme required for sulfatase activity